MDKKLSNIANTYFFLDDILIVTKGNQTDHYARVKQVLEKLDEANIRLKWEKCKFAQSEVAWLGYHLTQTGIRPINTKIQAITDKLKPKYSKELRLYMGAVKQLNRFIPNLAQLCFKLRPLLKQDNPWSWNETHDNAFEEINKHQSKESLK